MSMTVTAVCRICGASGELTVEDYVYNDRVFLTATVGFYACPGCVQLEEERRAREYKQQRDAELQYKWDCDYRKRFAISNFGIYELPYDPKHPKANSALDAWIGEHRYRSLWIAGHTGLCKSRLVQKWGLEMLKSRTVQYWPAADLLNHLSGNAKRLDEVIWSVYRADLLILDDLGTETITEAKYKYLFAILDRRYLGFNQARHHQRSDHPEFHWGGDGKRLGAQIWVTTMDDGSRFVQGMGADGPAALRRISEMCEFWEKF